MTKETGRDAVYRLFVKEKKTQGEIQELLSKRLSNWTIQKYIMEAIKKAEFNGDKLNFVGVSSPPRRAKKFSTRSVKSIIHRSIGIRLNSFRTLTKSYSCSEFCSEFNIANHYRIREMELGFYDFSLSELQQLSEIMSISIGQLLEPLKINVTSDKCE